jgi:uncharacterized Zn-binding protein involved in type VI secretion
MRPVRREGASDPDKESSMSKPAARQSDSNACPLPGHGVNPTVTGSPMSSSTACRRCAWATAVAEAIPSSKVSAAF